jgi:tetratricopeptide (TPR) repeat protein
LLAGFSVTDSAENFEMLKCALSTLVLFILCSTAYSQENDTVPRVVVAGFANKSEDGTVDWIGFGLRKDLTRCLMRVKGLIVQDTPAFERARNELGLVKKDLSKPDEAVKIGSALGTDKVLVGYYDKAPTGVKVVVRLVDTASEEITGPEITRVGSPTSVSTGLALDIAKALGVEVSNAGAVAVNLTSNSDAYENYCRGLQYKDSEETYEKAIEHFIKAAEEDEEYAAPHFELAWLFTVTGPAMYRSAVKEYRKAVSLYPEYAEAYNNLGVLQMRLEHPQSARAALLKSLELLPNYVDAHFNLGRLYDSLGQYEKAIEEYKKTVKLSPSDAIAHNNLGAAFLNKGQNDAALEAYSAALKLMPDLKEAHLGLGLVYQSKGSRELAIMHYQKYFDLGGYDEDIRETLEQLKKEQE